MQLKQTKSAELTTTPTFLAGTDSRTNVILDRIVVESYDDTATDTILIETGDGATLAELEVSTGRDTPFVIDLGVTSGSGIEVSVGSPQTRARAYYHISSRRHELPNGL